MYKQLCTDGLGVTVRQNELIELALTYQFRSIEIDMEDMIGRAESMGHQFATQFVNSATVEIGTFRLPIDLSADDDKFDKQFERLEIVCDLAEKIGARCCYLNIAASHPTLPYHENFEKHRARIGSIAERLGQSDITVGLAFNAITTKPDQMRFITKAEEIVTLVKTIDLPNVGLVLDIWNWQASEGTLDQIKALDGSRITEVRFADPPETLDGTRSADQVRMTPGTHPTSICCDVLEWLRDAEYQGPASLNAVVPKTTANPNENLFHRINRVFDRLLSGEGVEEPVAEGDDEEAAEEAVSTAAE